VLDSEERAVDQVCDRLVEVIAYDGDEVVSH
jgi:hypothetical protein